MQYCLGLPKTSSTITTLIEGRITYILDLTMQESVQTQLRPLTRHSNHYLSHIVTTRATCVFAAIIKLLQTFLTLPAKTGQLSPSPLRMYAYPTLMLDLPGSSPKKPPHWVCCSAIQVISERHQNALAYLQKRIDNANPFTYRSGRAYYELCPRG